MAKVYSDRFYVKQGLSGTETLDVPAGVLWVVRDVWVFAGAEVIFTKQWHLIGDAGQTFDWAGFTVVNPEPLHFWQGRQVILESLTVMADPGPLDVSISGYVLTLP